MYNKLAKLIVNRYIKKAIIKKSDFEIYVYCFEKLISQAISYFCMFIIAIIFDKLLHTILFYIGFMLFRKVSGGYHAKTILLCNILILFIVLLT